jgi:hypothetical protein
MSTGGYLQPPCIQFTTRVGADGKLKYSVSHTGDFAYTHFPPGTAEVLFAGLPFEGVERNLRRLQIGIVGPDGLVHPGPNSPEWLSGNRGLEYSLLRGMIQYGPPVN